MRDFFIFKGLIFLLGAFFAKTPVSHSMNQNYSLKNFELWSQRILTCEPNTYYQEKRAPLKEDPNIFISFRCHHGGVQSNLSFTTSSGVILFETGYHKSIPTGFALYHSNPKQLFVWQNNHLIPWNKIPLLPQKFAPTKNEALNGSFLRFVQQRGQIHLLTLKNGILNGVFGVHTSQAQNQSIWNTSYSEGQVPIDANPYPHPEYITTSPTPLEAFDSHSPTPPSCSREIAASSDEILKKMENSIFEEAQISWVRKPDSSEFKKYFKCQGQPVQNFFHGKDGLINVTIDCSQQKKTGAIKVYHPETARLIFHGQYSQGLPDGTWLYYNQGATAGKVVFDNGRINEVCLLGLDARVLVNPKAFPEPAAHRQSLWALTAEQGTREKFAGGILYSPNFKTSGGGAAGYFGEMEYLNLEKANQWRASAGAGFFAFFYLGHASLGVRFEKEKYQGVDATLGLGLGLVSGYARAIYNSPNNSLNGEIGLKLFVPLSLL